MYCKNCGNKLNEDEKFCANCGVSVEKEDHIIESNSNNKKNNNSKTIVGIIVGVLIIAIIGGVGFVLFFKSILSKSNNDVPETIDDIAIRYVEKKYNDNCVYSGSIGDRFLSGTARILARCDRLDKAILIEVENYRNKSERKFLDSYLSAKYESEIFELLKELVAESGIEESNIYGDFSDKTSVVDANISFEDFIKTSEINFYFYVETKKSNILEEQQMEKLKELLIEKSFRFKVYIAVVDDDKFGSYTFKEIEDLVIQEKIESHYITNR